MPSIIDLPCEVVASILGNLDNLGSLLMCLLVCRHFYSSYKESSGIESAILKQHISPALLPYAVAVAEAAQLPLRRSATSVRNLLDTLYNEPSQLASRSRTMPRHLIGTMARRHDIMHSLVSEFVTSAWTRLAPRDASDMSENSSLSPHEYYRFCRAFYRVELFYSLFHSEPADATGPFEESMNPWFFWRHPPWENEQLGCVQEFLEAKLVEASRDVVAHDVELGEFSIDYLTVGGENQRLQLWLAQGVEFTYQVVNASSYDVRRALLTKGFDSGGVNLPDALGAVFEADPEEQVALKDYDEERIQSLIRLADDVDEDEGPYKAWRAAHHSLPCPAWLMLLDDAWLRRRDYVFWNWDRMEKHDLLELFESSPGSPGPFFGDEEYEDMQESFDERSQIWRKSGAGYWSKGDYGRIVWPSQSIESGAS